MRKHVVDVRGKRCDGQVDPSGAGGGGELATASLTARSCSPVRRVTIDGVLAATTPGLVVIEAMPLEIDLRATAPAVVTAACVVVGSAVMKGAVRVELA